MPRMLAALLATLGGAAAAQPLEVFTLGSGVVSGGYFAAASAICETVNRDGVAGLRCSPDPTSGSIYNLDALRRGDLDLALVQSDLQRQAVEGTGAFAAAGPMPELRSVLGLYPEAITVLARRQAGIGGLDELAGRRVDIGHPASARHATALELFRTLGVDTTTFSALDELPVGAAIDALCSGRIDATLLITGHPNSGTARALGGCDAVLVPVEGSEIDAMVAASADFEPWSIARGAYPGLDADTPTFAVTATLVARADTDPTFVTEVVTSVVDNLPALGQRSGVLAGLDPAALGTQGLVAPLHPAAAAVLDAR